MILKSKQADRWYILNFFKNRTTKTEGGVAWKAPHLGAEKTD